MKKLIFSIVGVCVYSLLLVRSKMQDSILFNEFNEYNEFNKDNKDNKDKFSYDQLLAIEWTLLGILVVTVAFIYA